MAADVWEKDVWEFQAKSGSSGSCRLLLHFLGKIAVQEMSGRTPGSPSSKFHFARFTLSCPPNTSVFLPRPLRPLCSPVLARPRSVLACSSPVPRPFLARPRPALARPRPALARPPPTLVSSNLAVKTGKREIYEVPGILLPGIRGLLAHMLLGHFVHAWPLGTFDRPLKTPKAASPEL